MKRKHLCSLPAVVFAFILSTLAGREAIPQTIPPDSKAPEPSRHEAPRQVASAAPPFTLELEGQLSVHADKTATEVTTKRITINSAAAVQSLSQEQVSFVEGMQTLEALEAYTQKADGRRIPLGNANVIKHDTAAGLQAVYASDSKTITYLFPDVAIGDTLVMTLKVEYKRDFFVGEFMDFSLVARSSSVTSARYTVEAPASLNLFVGVSGQGISDETQVVGEVRRHLIRVVGEPFQPEEPGAVSPIDRDPTVSVSTFQSYAELGRAYGKAALPRAGPTPEITALADDITRGVSDRREQAAAIDAWVKKNIRYVAVYFSIGRVVPHDAATVLINKFGDCKDKVTLMSALLAAKGIASETVLINSGPAYTLPEPPTLAVLNHAIVYLPEFDLYDDPTASSLAFGTLAQDTYDKPVVRISAADATLARTPPARAENHTSRVRTLIQFAADGTVSGQSEEKGTGSHAGSYRITANAIQQAGGDGAAQRQLQSFSTPGTGHFDLGHHADLLDPVTLKNDFRLNGRFKPPAPGGFAPIPIGLRTAVRPGTNMLGARLNGRSAAFICFAGSQSEDIEATFDPALPMPIPPAATNISNPFFDYRSSYRVESRILKIHREFVSHVPRQLCPATAEAVIAADMSRVSTDVHSLYRFNNLAITDYSSEVITGERKRIAFLYELNADCSSRGFAKVSTVDPPKQGKISVNPAAGMPHYADKNPRSHCNANQTDGMEVAYEANDGFTGVDKLTVEITYADGTAAKRRYAIKVEPRREGEAGPSPSLNHASALPSNPSGDGTAPKPSPVRVLEAKRIAVRDQTLRVAAFFQVNPDCSVIGIPVVRIVSPSTKGKVVLENGTGFTTYPASNPRSKCNSSRSDGAVISYLPELGYVGTDSMTVEIIYASGTMETRRYTIEVR